MSTAVFDQTWQRERDRLRALEDLFDPASRRQLAERGHPPTRAVPRTCAQGRQPGAAPARCQIQLRRTAA